MRRFLGVAGVTAAIVIAAAAPAAAHAALESSDPAAGAALRAAPAAITLTFTEPPDAELSRIEVLDVAGGAAGGGRPRVDGHTLTLAPTDELADGVYTVTWRVVSRVDGHLTTGTFSFGIGVEPDEVVAPPGAPSSTPPPTVLSVASRMLLYAGIAVAVAGGLVGTSAMGGTFPGRKPLLLAAAGAMLVGAVGIVLAERATVDVPLVDLLRADAGRSFAWLIAFALVAAAATTEAALGGGTVRLAVAAAAAAALALVRSLGGHAGAGPQAGLQWAHILAVSTWIGGLALLALALRGPDPARVARRYSRLAVWAAPLVVVTGLIRASGELGGIGWLGSAFDTTYGTVLVAKIAIVVVVLGLGAFNRYRAIPRMQAGTASLLRRVVATELVLAAGVLGLTGTITGLPPDPEPEATTAPAPRRIEATGTDFATTARVSLAATPGIPGTNELTLEVTDPDTGAPLAADAVELRFAPVGRSGVAPSTLELEADGPRWLATSGDLSLAGVWRVTATVRRGADAVEVPLVLTTRGPTQRIERVETPGAPTIFTMRLPDGLSIQGYVDPGAAGANQLHLTAFDGPRELPLRSGTFAAIGPDGEPEGLDAERFGPGHFVANWSAEAGPWRFVLTAIAEDGRSLQATFDEELAG